LFSRSRLKLGLWVCLTIFGFATVLLFNGRPRAFFGEDMIFFLEGTSAAGAVAISIVLFATI